MLPDLSAAHIFLLVVVALVVVGPKDLPGLLRKIGQFMARLRGMANEFRASFDEMARQSELDELRREVEAMRAAAARPAADFRAAAGELHGQLMQQLEVPPEIALAEPAPVVEAGTDKTAQVAPKARPAASSKPKPASRSKSSGVKVAGAAKPASPKTSEAKAPDAKAAKPAAKRAKPKASAPVEPGQ